MVCSIRVNLIHEQDRNRFTVLDLVHGDSDGFDIVQEMFGKMNDEYFARLYSRSVHMLPTILKSYDSFHEALFQKYNGRFGQQYGTLLAGYYAAISDEVIEIDEARQIVSELDLSEESSVIKDKDELDCLNHLMGKMVSVELDGTKHERTVGEIIELSRFGQLGKEVSMRMGLIVESDQIYISATHPYLKERIFNGTKWSNNWTKPLARLNGARRHENLKRFGTLVSRSVIVPFSCIFDQLK